MERREFTQLAWDAHLEEACRQLARLAVREDLDRFQDWTTLALIEPEREGRARLVARQDGVLAGLAAVATILDEMQTRVAFEPLRDDGRAVRGGEAVGELAGSVRDMLVAERTVLNFLGRLSGIATKTRAFVDAVAEFPVRIYDTRKTLPGWRHLEKYAVRCGGGHNHRTGLWDAVLIKDNHLAFAGLAAQPHAAVERARTFLRELAPHYAALDRMIVEIEVDSLDQLRDVLPAAPDIVLLDNMSCDDLRAAVALRNAAGVATELEASGGVHYETLRAIAATGVERISAGALTHSAINFDIALDWI